MGGNIRTAEEREVKLKETELDFFLERNMSWIIQQL